MPTSWLIIKQALSRAGGCMCKYMEFWDEIVMRADIRDSDTAWELLESGFHRDAPLTGDIVSNDFVKSCGVVLHYLHKDIVHICISKKDPSQN